MLLTVDGLSAEYIMILYETKLDIRYIVVVDSRKCNNFKTSSI